MTEKTSQTVTEQLSEIASTVSDGVKKATSTVEEAIDKGRKPGNALDVLSKMTREAPLGMLLAAFLVGRFLARRR